MEPRRPPAARSGRTVLGVTRHQGPHESFEWVTAHAVFGGLADFWRARDLAEEETEWVVARLVQQARQLRNYIGTEHSGHFAVEPLASEYWHRLADVVVALEMEIGAPNTRHLAVSFAEWVDETRRAAYANDAH